MNKQHLDTRLLELKKLEAGIAKLEEERNAVRKEIFGIVEDEGLTDGYLSRNIGEVTPEKPKYRFPDGLHKSLEMFGAWQLKEKAPHRVIYLVESPFSVMKFHQLGLPGVSPFGWSVSAEQIAIVADLAKGVICLPDSDKAEAFAPYAHALSRRMWARCPAMPQGVADPELLTLDQIKSLT